MTVAEHKRDIIVLGASAGGIEAVGELLSQLPHDLQATIFLAQHMSPVHVSRLPEVLTKRGPFRALYPVHGQAIAPRQLYIAPPDNQLLVRDGYVHVTRGPKENGHRPSVDALFRSAARAYGPRVIGVVLTGYLDCGTSGLLSIKARGGLSVVQDPEQAYAPEMPRSAIAHVEIDYVSPLSGMGALLARLVKSPAGTGPSSVSRSLLEIEGDEPGVPAEVVCPICRGATTEAAIGEYKQFRCHVGHTFSFESMLSEQTEETERALWAAVRAIEESASLAQRMAARSHGEMELRYREKHETLSRQADVIRRLLLGTGPDAPALSNGTEAAVGSDID